MWKFSSYVSDTFLPTPPEVFFLPRTGWNAKPVDKFTLALTNAFEVFVLDAGILPHHVDHAVVAIFDRNGNKTLLLEGTDVGANLPFADAKELGEVAVGCIAAVFVVQGLNLDKENFLHERKLLGEPNLLGNPHALEITG